MCLLTSFSLPYFTPPGPGDYRLHSLPYTLPLAQTSMVGRALRTGVGLDWDKRHQLSLTARNLLDSESFLHFISKTVFVFALGSLKTIVLSFGHMSHFYNVKRAPFEAEKLNQS